MRTQIIILLIFFSYGCSSNRKVLVDNHATLQTKALYKNLFITSKKGIMFGHQDDTLYGVGWSYEPNRSDVKSVCGEYPAVYGWELGGLELGWDKNIDDVPFDVMRKHIIEAYLRGGVNTISWHPHNPESGLTAWDSKTTSAVKSILPTGIEHDKYILWLNRISDFINSLRKNDGQLIPVLFRPFHENTSTGFWWTSAQCTVEEYISLWHFTVCYLRDEKKLNNLIYVYSPDLFKNKEHYLERYPGDKWVDVLGMDAYNRQQDWDFISGGDRMLSTLVEIGNEKKKPVAFTETGLEALPDAKWWTNWLLPILKNKRLSYVLVWRNSSKLINHYFAPYPGSKSASDFIEFKNNKEVHILFGDDIKNMYK